MPRRQPALAAAHGSDQQSRHPAVGAAHSDRHLDAKTFVEGDSQPSQLWYVAAAMTDDATSPETCSKALATVFGIVEARLARTGSPA